MKKTTLLFILFSCFFLVSYSQDIYSSRWKRIDSLLQKEGLTETASKEVDAILKNARAANQQPQIIKALQYKMTLDMQKDEQALEKSIKRFEAELKVAAEPGKSVIQSLLAESYWNYLQANRYRLYNAANIPPSDKSELSGWSVNALSAKISGLYLQSIRQEALLQKTPVAKFDAIIEKGNARKYRPTLFDLLAYRALDYFKNDEAGITQPANRFQVNRKEYFSPIQEFIRLSLRDQDTTANAYFALTLFKKLLQAHLNDADASAKIDADIQRVEYVYQRAVLPGKDALYLDALEHIISANPGHPAADQASFLLASYYATRASRYDALTDTSYRNDYKKALQVLEKVILSKNQSEGYSNAVNLKNQILAVTLTPKMEAVNVPDQPFRVALEYKNASKLYYRIIRIDAAKRDSFIQRSWEDEFWRKLIALPAINQQSVALPPVDDHQLHRVEFGIDPLPTGEYALITSDSPDFVLNRMTPLALNRFWVSSISYIQSRNEFYVLDRNSGQPLQGAMANIYKLSRTGQDKNPTWTILSTHKTDANGKFSVIDNPQEYAQRKIEFRYKNDFLSKDFQPLYYRYNDEDDEDDDAIQYEEDHQQAYLFTDRSIYRPGQQLFFKGLYITKDRTSRKPKCRSGFKTTIYLNDANGQVKDSIFLTTNEYGSVTGNFRIPAGLLNGEFTITDKNTGATAGVSVEEYKRPKFMVDLKMPGGSFRVNDSVTVHGIAKAFAGNSIGGAKLNYKVVRKTILPLWIRYQPGKIWPPRRAEETIISTGSTTTSASGEFAIAFKAQPDPETDPSLYPSFHYEVAADVIDMSGESHSSSITVVAGYQSIQVAMNLPGVLQADSLTRLNISTTNLNDVFQKAGLLINFTKLVEPAAVYRRRYWQQPDQFIYTEKEFHQRFPFDEYANESTPSQWKKGLVVLTVRDSSSLNPIKLPKTLAPGYYEMEVDAFSSAGDTVHRKQIIHLTGTTEQLGAAYVHLDGKQSSLQLNENWPTRILTNLKDIYLVKQFAVNEQVQPATVQLIQSAVTDDSHSVNQYGNARLDIAFVKNNRFYSESLVVPINDESKKLDIQLTSFRNKVIPGSKETWTLKVAGSKGEKLAAEVLTGMYDRSLDQFRSHSWAIPDVWNSPLVNSSFEAPGNFQMADLQQRYIQQDQAVFFDKTYDRLESANLPGYERMLSGRLAGVQVQQDAPLKDVVVNALSVKKQTSHLEDSAATAAVPKAPVVQARKDFRETAFFFPALSTDPDGNLQFSYTMPEALTSWKWMTMAHTKDLAIGYRETEIISQKELMVQPNLPRFLREGDRIDLSTRIVNMTGEEMTGQVQLELIDPETNQSVDGWFRNVFPNQYFTVAAGQTGIASFSLEVPFQYARPVIYRITATNASRSDAEEGILPVLLSKIMVTETATLPLFNQKKKQVRLEKLLNSGGSETLTNQSLTVEFTSNPSWFAIQSLPHLAEIKDGSSEQVFYRIYSGSLVRKILESNPTIAEVYEKWKQSDTSMRSKLEQNESLKSVLLQQTPWVLDAKTETENIVKLAEMFRYWKVQQNLLDAVNQLKSLQQADGSFSWMNGGPADRFVTQNIVIGIGRLMHMNALNKELTDELNGIASAAFSYIDQELQKDYERQKKSKTPALNIDPLQVQYLYMRSLFPSKDVPGPVFKAYNHYRKLATTAWVRLPRQLQGMTALALYRTGDKFNAARILRSLKENALNNEEMGMYWKASNFGYTWFESSVSTQAILIETFSELSNDTLSIDRMKLWLIKNKQTNSWTGDKSTADACYALLNTGTRWITGNAQIQIQLGSMKIEPTAADSQAGSGYFLKTIEGAKVKPEMGDITVFVKNDSVRQPMYGAVYWKYMEDLDKLTADKSPVVIRKRLFTKSNSAKGTVYTEISENATLKLGDRVLVRLEIRSDRSLEYVHISDMRASGMEPVTTLSGYNWKAGLSYYEVTRDASSDFYIERLPKGSFRVEYELVLNNTGTFTNGISTVQCLYAPEFTGHSTSVRFHAEAE